jgi:phosphoribosylformylglycinamidine cyclo-ligase
MPPITYKDAGVDIERGDKFADSIYELMQRTFDGRVVELPGGFAGLFSIDFEDKLWRRNYKRPVLVSSTDGVGTKLKVAFMSGKHDTIGIDLVAMNVNDILVLGAEPLFFLDYLATSRIEQDVLWSVVKGVSDGCRMAECALLGGETAEMPGFYQEGEYDVAGFVVGVVERRKMVTGARITVGDLVIGLPSSGLHSNGYSLARAVIFGRAKMKPDDSLSSFGIHRTVADELLTPTRIYVRSVRSILGDYKVKQTVHGMAHITGSGLPGNIERILPPGCAIELDSRKWQRPKIFDVIQQLGDVPLEDMYNTFNMGIGFVLIVAPYYADSIMEKLEKLGEQPVLIGRVKKGDRKLTIT